MMRTAFRIIFAASLTAVTSVALADGLSGTWLLTIENLEHKEIASLVISFTNTDARSCLSGEWKRILVKSSTTIDNKFFPVSHPLSFQLNGSSLTIGRNEICDDYLHLTGTLVDGVAAGSYGGFGLSGGEDLGFFTLRGRNVDPPGEP
jgi:hypothetical protein